MRTELTKLTRKTESFILSDLLLLTKGFNMDWSESDKGKSAAQYKELCTQIKNSKKGSDPMVIEILNKMSHTQTFYEHYILIRELFKVVME